MYVPVPTTDAFIALWPQQPPAYLPSVPLRALLATMGACGSPVPPATPTRMSVGRLLHAVCRYIPDYPSPLFLFPPWSPSLSIPSLVILFLFYFFCYFWGGSLVPWDLCEGQRSVLWGPSSLPAVQVLA